MYKINQKKSIDLLLRNTSFGVFAGAEFTLFMCWFNSSTVAEGLASPLSTHLTIGVTLAASALALIGVFCNIENQNAINTENRHKKFLASRAFLPHALMELTYLCKNGMAYSNGFSDFENQLGKTAFEEKSIKDLSISESTTMILRDIIELSDEKTVSDRLSGILREHQILLARWKGGFRQGSTTKITLPDDESRRTVAWAYLGAICASMFSFSRGESKIVNTKVTYKEISGIIATSDIAGLDEEDHAKAIAHYTRIFEHRFAV